MIRQQNHLTARSFVLLDFGRPVLNPVGKGRRSRLLVSHIHIASKLMRYQPDCDKTRWMAYFDILGVRELIAAGKEGQVFGAYDFALEQFDEHKKWAPLLGHAWFSDTFLIVAPDDSKEFFDPIDRMARYFVDFMLRARIPLRGAISCDHLYADFKEGVFLGRALIEAYAYGEGQDWIGLL